MAIHTPRKRRSCAHPRPIYLDMLPDEVVFELCVHLERPSRDEGWLQHEMQSMVRLGAADRRCRQLVKSWALRNADKPFTAADAYLMRTAYQIIYSRAMTFLNDPKIVDFLPVEQWVQGRVRGLSMSVARLHKLAPRKPSPALLALLCSGATRLEKRRPTRSRLLVTAPVWAAGPWAW